MIKKRKLTLGLASSLLLLAACNSDMTADDLSQSATDIQTSYDELIDIHKQLVDLELNLDDQFVEVLENDDTLASIADDSAAVINNINERTSLVEGIEEHIAIIQEQAEYLGDYEGTDFPSEAILQLSQEFSDFSSEIGSYQANYLESLNVQTDYFKNIAAADANYEDFATGIDTVNENYQELQDFIVEFDTQFVNINEQFNVINRLIAEETETAKALVPSVAAEGEDTDDAEDGEAEAVAAEPTSDIKTEILTVNTKQLLSYPQQFPKKFVYDSGVDIDYPEGGVKGIYVTAHSAGGERMERLVNLLNSTDLNSMVIDIKDDHGNVTLDLNSDDELVNEMTNELIDAEELMATLEENNIYPIARIVVFKDTHLAKAHPEWSFTHPDGSVWSNNRGESFVNPYIKEVWDYNIEVAVQAAKLGFKDIQFDYVRFPEGFENRAESLNYSTGHYANDGENVVNMEYRNRAVTEFVREAKQRLMPYGADLSVDIFGYAAVVRETPGIGQSFPGISKEVDVISSMIYPSHWGPGNLGIAKPDLEPYNVVNNYMEVELEILEELGDEAPITRPWIQDFTASYLGAGNYIRYGATEVTAQVRALADNGVHEFLLWNAGNTYSEGATYTFE